MPRNRFPAAEKTRELYNKKVVVNIKHPRKRCLQTKLIPEVQAVKPLKCSKSHILVHLLRAVARGDPNRSVPISIPKTLGGGVLK